MLFVPIQGINVEQIIQESVDGEAGNRLDSGLVGDVLAVADNCVDGCAACHRPSWTTGDDNYWTPAMNGRKPLPRYAHQTIYPYSDFIQHRLWMINDIHGTWCRTTPLWGRGLSAINTGREDRLHDNRARNTVEAIMWHGYSKKSDAYGSAEKFYNLKKEDRDAVVKFINSI